jgi:hypothetical protein
MYKATGINSNFQWCGIGFSQLPNGCGFGGAQGATNMGQFALYVDSTLDTGMSRPIATFGNEPLTSHQVFQVMPCKWSTSHSTECPFIIMHMCPLLAV